MTATAHPDRDLETLLRLGLRARWDADTRASLPALLAGTRCPWSGLAGEALRRGVGPRLLAALAGWAPLPEAVAGSLWRDSRAVAGRNHLLLGELGAVLRQLAANGIPCIVLKGAALVEQVYGLARRPMDDLDLLVRVDDVAAASRVLQALGFRPAEQIRPGYALRFGGEMLFRKPGLIQVMVDLHWSLVNSAWYRHRVPVDWFWQTAQPSVAGGAPARILGCEAQVIHAGAHLQRHHHGAGLAGWCDLADVVLAFGEQLDWRRLLDAAQAGRMLLPLQRSLPVLAGDWRVPLPGGLLERLPALRPAPEEMVIWADRGPARRSGLAALRAQLAGLPQHRLRLLLVRDLLFPSRRYMQRQFPGLPPALLPASYPYRWFRGLGRMLPAALRADDSRAR